MPRKGKRSTRQDGSDPIPETTPVPAETTEEPTHKAAPPHVEQARHPPPRIEANGRVGLSPGLQVKLDAMQAGGAVDTSGATTAGGAPTPEQARAQLLQWLERVLPENKTITFEDLAGVTHEATIRLPARRQFAVARRWNAVTKELDVGKVQSLMSGGDEFIDALLKLLTAVVAEDRKVEELLYWTFTLLHPVAVKHALSGEAGKLAEESAGEWLGDDTVGAKPDAGDVFATEEMISAILPFSTTILRRVFTILAEAGEKTST